MTTQGDTAAAESKPLPGDAIGAVLADYVQVCTDGVAVLDAGDRYLYVNPAGCRMLGSPAEQLQGSAAFFGGGLGPDPHHTDWTSPAWIRWAHSTAGTNWNWNTASVPG